MRGSWSVWRACLAVVISLGLAGTARARAPVKLTGDLSHRLLEYKITESTQDPQTGRTHTTVKSTATERVRLHLAQTTQNLEWRCSLFTIDTRNFTSSALPLARQSDHVLSPGDFHFVNFYAQRNLTDRFRVRLGRTQVPFMSYKSELLWDNNIAWDGLWIEAPSGFDRNTVWHGGVFQVHSDLRFRGDRLQVVGLLGTPRLGSVKAHWRIDHFDCDLREVSRFAPKACLRAPGYRTINLSGSLEWPNQLRLSLDVSRNVRANAPGADHRGGEAINATVLAGRLRHNGTSQFVCQYWRLGPHAVPTAFASYPNLEGPQLTWRYRLTRQTSLAVEFYRLHRVENHLASDQHWEKWKYLIDHAF